MSAQASVLPTLQAARVTIYLRLFSELKVTNDHLPQVLFIRAAMKKHVKITPCACQRLHSREAKEKAK